MQRDDRKDMQARFMQSEAYQTGFASLVAFMQRIIPDKRAGFADRIEVHEKMVTDNLCNFVHDCLHFAFKEIIAEDGNIKPEIAALMPEANNQLQDNEFKWSLIASYTLLFMNSNELVLERLNAIKINPADKTQDFSGLATQIYLKFVNAVLNHISDLVKVKRMPVDENFDLCLAKLFFSSYSLQTMIAASAREFYVLENKDEPPVVTLDADEQELVTSGMKEFYDCLADKEKLEEAVKRSQFLSESKTKLAFVPAYPFYYYTEMLKQPADERALDLRIKPEKMEHDNKAHRYDERALDVMRDFFVLNPAVYRLLMKRPHEFRFALGCIEFFVMDNIKKVLDKKYGFDNPELIRKKQLLLSKLTDDIISGLTADRVAQAVRRYDSARPMFEMYVKEFTKLQQVTIEDQAENQLKDSACEAIQDILSHELSYCRSISAREGCYQRFALMCEQKRLSYLTATEKSLHDQLLDALKALVTVLHLAHPEEARYKVELKTMVDCVNELYRTIDQMTESIDDMLEPYMMSRFNLFLSNPALLTKITNLAELAVLDNYGEDGTACRYHLLMLQAALQRIVHHHLFQMDVRHLSHADVSFDDAVEKFEHHAAVMRANIESLDETGQAPLAIVLSNELDDLANQAAVIKEDDALDNVSKIIAMLNLTDKVVNLQSEPASKKQASSLTGESMDELEASAFLKIMHWREMSLADIQPDEVRALVTVLHDEVLEPSLEYQFLSVMFIHEALGILHDDNYSEASRSERLVDLLRLYSMKNQHAFLNLNSCNFNKIVLSDIDRANLQMRDATLFRCIIDHCSLQDSNMSGTRFTDSELTNSFFQQTDFTKACFDGSLLRAVNFQSCSLSHATFLSVKFEEDVTFEHCDLIGAQFVPYDYKLSLNKWLNFFELAIKLKLPDEVVHENIDKNILANVTSYQRDMSDQLKARYVELKAKKGSDLPFFRKYTGAEIKTETHDKKRDNKP